MSSSILQNKADWGSWTAGQATWPESQNFSTEKRITGSDSQVVAVKVFTGTNDNAEEFMNEVDTAFPSDP